MPIPRPSPKSFGVKSATFWACRPFGPSRMTAHLWRHGLVDQTVGETHLYSAEHKAGIAGDWCHGRLAEHAFESGDKLGRAIIDSFN